MPNKDILKRRATFMRWYRKNKDKAREYRRVQWIARKNNPIAQKCHIPNCENIGERHHPDYSKPAEIVWVCRKHHRREYHKGKCSMCGDTARARGFCNKHYKSERKRLEPAYREKDRLSKIRKK